MSKPVTFTPHPVPSMLRVHSLAFVAIALPLLSGAQTVAGRRDSVFTWQGALRPHAVLQVRNFNGPIDVRPSSGATVELRAVKRRPRNDGALDDVGLRHSHGG